MPPAQISRSTVVYTWANGFCHGLSKTRFGGFFYGAGTIAEVTFSRRMPPLRASLYFRRVTQAGFTGGALLALEHGAAA